MKNGKFVLQNRISRIAPLFVEIQQLPFTNLSFIVKMLMFIYPRVFLANLLSLPLVIIVLFEMFFVNNSYGSLSGKVIPNFASRSGVYRNSYATYNVTFCNSSIIWLEICQVYVSTSLCEKYQC